MNAVIAEQLVAVARAAREAGHGGKEAVYAAACERLGMSRATLLTKLKGVAVSAPRKRRSDAGLSALDRQEAMLISATLMESAKKNGKQLYTVADAVAALRSNGMVKADYVDESSGEVRKLSESAISRALRTYNLHPEQLLAPAPALELKANHPNHVWQIDASLCVLYYLKPTNNPKENGLRVMNQEAFYKNKPKNLQRVMADRVWSYELTDMVSGWIYAEYVMGAESGENLCNVLINALQERGVGQDILHGVPSILYMDKGSAMTAGMTKNLCRSLGIQIESHAAGNARATGQVEKARDILERKFESGLKFIAVPDLNGLNELVKKWRGHFNATAIHSRHGMTRSQAWMQIKPEQLVKAPSVEVCRELAVAMAEKRKVTTKLRVNFQGNEYDVSSVPNVMVHEWVMVTRNPWRDDAAQVVLTDNEGHEVYHICPLVVKDEFGYATTAVTVGEGYKRMADTPTQTALKEIEKLVTGTDTLEAAAAARKGKALPFGGQLDPYKYLDDDKLPTYLPRRGTQHDLVAPKVELPKLNHVALAKKLKAKLGEAWNAESYPWLVRTYPEGASEDEVDAIVERMTVRPKLQLIVGGGAR